MRTVPRRPRIAVTGSAGVGKSTLARAVSDRLGVPLVDEGMRRRLEAGLDLRALGRDGLRDLLLELFAEMMADTQAATAEAGGFVADRASLDVAAFWLYYGFGHDAAATADLISRVRDTVELYDLIVILPWGALPLQDDRIRTANPWLQLHYHAVIDGLLARWAARTLAIPAQCVALDDRVARVTAALAAP